MSVQPDAIAYDVFSKPSWEQIRDELLLMVGTAIVIEIETEADAPLLSLVCSMRHPELLCTDSGQVLRFSPSDSQAEELVIAEDAVERAATTVGYVSVVIGTVRLSITRWVARTNPSFG